MGVLVTQSIADAQVDDRLPDLNRGTTGTMTVGFDSGPDGKTFRGLLRFLLGGLPNQATVDNATLKLHYTNDGGGFTATINYITTSFDEWIETAVTWNQASGVQAWITPGGDFDETDRGEFSFSSVHPPDGDLLIDVKALVERAVAAGRDELSVIVKRRIEAFGTANQVFITREGSNPPELTVNYTLAPTFHDREAEVRMLIPVTAGDVLRVRGAQVRGVQELQAKPDGSSLALSLNH